MDDQKWRNALTEHRVKIVKELENPEDVADCLYSSGILTAEMKARICQKSTREDKTREILTTLNYRGKKSVYALYDAFKQTSNGHLADLLQIAVQNLELAENLTDPTTWPPTADDHERMQRDDVVKVSTNSSFLHEYNKKDVYTMHNKTRGKVLMINNEFRSTAGFSYREGSDKDVTTLKDIFEKLHFDVEPRINLSKKEMVEFLKDQRDKSEWDKMDCLVLVLMSHGEGSSIFDNDGIKVKISDLTDMFSSKNCRGLDKKPRLVFIQACRIEEKIAKEPSEMKKDELDAAPSNQQTASPENAGFEHPSADFLIAYATPEGTLSYRNIYTGSWFISAVAWTLKYHAHHEELQHLLIRVNRIVATGYGPPIKGDPTSTSKFTVSEVRSNLRKKLYFFPGIYGEKPELLKNEA